MVPFKTIRELMAFVGKDYGKIRAIPQMNADIKKKKRERFNEKISPLRKTTEAAGKD